MAATAFHISHFKFQIFLSLLSGLLLVVIQPPFSLFFLAFAALIPLFFAIEGATPRSAFVSGFLAGLASYLGLVYWVIVAMNYYGGIPIPVSACILLLLALYLSLYTGVFAFLVRYFERKHAIPVYITAPVAWTVFEYLRGFMLTGFPWSLLAHSQHNFLPFIQIASVTGTYFISFLIVSVNAILYCLLRRKTPHILYLASVVLLTAASLVYGFTALNEDQRPGLKTLLVQGNVPQHLKWTPGAAHRSLEKYIAVTALSGGGTDLVIWPETALPFVFDETEAAGQVLGALARDITAPIIFGAVSRGAGGGTFNSAFAIGKTGALAGRYDKVHLVPFGEFTPLVSYLPFLESMSVAGSGFARGSAHQPIATGIGPVGMLICYEGMFPAETNETVRNGAGVLVNITNDAWFGRTSAPHQHLAAYVFRAIETDRYVLRAANTGVSAVIDPKGRILSRTDLFTEATLKEGFSMKEGQTFYVRFGDYFVVLVCFLFICTIAAVAASERSRRGSRGPVSFFLRTPRR